VISVLFLLVLSLSLANTWLGDLAPFVVAVGLALLIRRQQGSWLAPGAFFALAWCVLAGLPLLILPDAAVWPPAIWWIVTSMIAVYLGSLWGQSGVKPPRIPIPNTASRFTSRELEWLILGLTLVGFVAVGALLVDRGLGPDVFLSIHKLARAARELSVARYSEGYKEPLLARLPLIGTYLASLLGGLLLATRTSGLPRYIAFAPVLPGLGIALLLTTKSAILYPLLLIAAAYLASRLAIGRDRFSVTRRSGLLTLVGIAALAPTLVLIQLSRYGYSLFSAKQVAATLTIMRVFVFGYLAVFATWFEHGGWHSSHLGLGAYTFAGIFDLAQLKQRVPGIYPVELYLTHDHIANNIYTIFRGLIEDYTVMGALIVLVTVGYLAGYAFARVRQGELLYVPVLSAFFAITLFSFVVDLFAYNTIIAAWLLFAGYMALSKSGTRVLVPRRSAIP
jgi:oligosaccharide repeat unit polymerase